jgi:hypothetical protein
MTGKKRVTQKARVASVVRRELNRIDAERAGLRRKVRIGLAAELHCDALLMGAQQALAWVLRDNAQAASKAFGYFAKPKRPASGKRRSRKAQS